MSAKYNIRLSWLDTDCEPQEEYLQDIKTDEDITCSLHEGQENLKAIQEFNVMESQKWTSRGRVTHKDFKGLSELHETYKQKDWYCDKEVLVAKIPDFSTLKLKSNGEHVLVFTSWIGMSGTNFCVELVEINSRKLKITW